MKIRARQLPSLSLAVRRLTKKMKGNLHLKNLEEYVSMIQSEQKEESILLRNTSSDAFQSLTFVQLKDILGRLELNAITSLQN